MKLEKEISVKKRTNLIMQVLVLGCFMLGLFFICPLKAEASEEDPTYGWGINTDMYIDGEQWINDGVVLKQFKSDGKGGTITYNRVNNTLTVKNYTFNGEVIDYYAPISARCMGKEFHIVLVGTNIIEKKGTSRVDYETGLERRGIELYWINCTTIEGSGKLISNVSIKTIVAGNKLVFKDCDIEISAPFSGVKGSTVELINANVDITIEDKNARDAYTGFEADYLKVDNSNLIVRGINHRTMWIRRRLVPIGVVDVDIPNSEMKYTDNWEDKIILGSDVKIADEEGNPLDIEKIRLDGIPLFLFFKNGRPATNIFITSTKKANLNQLIAEVVEKIEQIGIVSASSRTAIDNARNAYEALSRLGKEADYAKAKIFNYQKLVDAEAEYIRIVKQEQAGKEQEEEKENPNPNGAIVGSRTRKADKMIQVKGKKYLVKTPEFNSLKSKKRKTLTLSWKVDKNCDGYQIYYSRNKKFKNAKKLLIAKKTKKIKGEKTIKKLTSNKTYYVKIRAYKKVKGKRYYGNFSVIRKVKVK